MSIMVDPSLNWIFLIIAGDNFPQGDEDKLRELAAVWDQAAVDIVNAVSELNALAGHVQENVGGEVGQKFYEYAVNLGNNAPVFASTAEKQAYLARDFALNVEHAKYSMLIQIAFTAAEIIWALSNPFTAGLVPGFITAGRFAVQKILSSFMGRIGAHLAMQAAEEAIQEVAMDALAQIIQILEGNRHEWNVESTYMAAAVGGAAGVVGGGIGLGMKKWTPNLADTRWGEGINEGITEIIVGAGAAGATGGDFDTLWAGGLNGALSGAASWTPEGGDATNGPSTETDGPDLTAGTDGPNNPSGSEGSGSGTGSDGPAFGKEGPGSNGSGPGSGSDSPGSGSNGQGPGAAGSPPPAGSSNGQPTPGQAPPPAGSPGLGQQGPGQQGSGQQGSGQPNPQGAPPPAAQGSGQPKPPAQQNGAPPPAAGQQNPQGSPPAQNGAPPPAAGQQNPQGSPPPAQQQNSAPPPVGQQPGSPGAPPPATVTQPPAQQGSAPPPVGQSPEPQGSPPPAAVTQPPAQQQGSTPAPVGQSPGSQAAPPPAAVTQPPAQQGSPPPAVATQPPAQQPGSAPPPVGQSPGSQGSPPPATVAQPPAQQQGSAPPPAGQPPGSQAAPPPTAVTQPPAQQGSPPPATATQPPAQQQGSTPPPVSQQQGSAPPAVTQPPAQQQSSTPPPTSQQGSPPPAAVSQPPAQQSGSTPPLVGQSPGPQTAPPPAAVTQPPAPQDSPPPQQQGSPPPTSVTQPPAQQQGSTPPPVGQQSGAQSSPSPSTVAQPSAQQGSPPPVNQSSGSPATPPSSTVTQPPTQQSSTPPPAAQQQPAPQSAAQQQNSALPPAGQQPSSQTATPPSTGTQSPTQQQNPAPASQPPTQQGSQSTPPPSSTTEQNSPQPTTNLATEAPHTQHAPVEIQVTSDSDTDSDPGTDFDSDSNSDTNTDYDSDSEPDDQNTFSSPKDWGDRRDTAHPAKQSSERFDPDNTGRTGNGQLSGKITQIRYDLRRFEVSPGHWVREFTVPIKLVSTNGSVNPESLKQLGDKVSQSVNTHYNQQYHLPGGDQLHITVEFDPAGVPVEVIDSTVDKGRPATNQAQWDVRDDPDGLTHEVLHFLGLGEGYADPDMLFNRQDQPGIMGKDAWNGATFLTDQNLGKIDDVAQTAGPVRDNGLGDQSPPPTERPTGNPSPDFGPDSLHTPSKAPPVALTTAQVQTAMPDYMADNKGLGPSKQLRPTNNADIRPGLITLSPQLRGNPALDIIQGQIDTNAGSFLGKGRPFTITVGKRSMELTVRGAFDWNGMTVDNTVTDTEKAKPSGKDTRKSDNSASDSRNTDLNLSGFMSAAPPLVISAGIQVPTGVNSAHDTKTSKDVGSSSNVEVDGMREVKAPITFTYELVDSDNHRVGPVDQNGQPVVNSVTGDVDLSVPTTFTRPGTNPLKTLTQAPPTKFGVEEAVSTTPDGDFFQQVAADLPPHLKEIGAPGRSVLQNFLSDANIKKNLPAMTVYDGTANPDKGWIRSDPLIKNSNSKKWSSKGNAVEMRAVARQVRVIETVDGVKNTDTDSYKNVTSEKNSAKHNVGGNLMVGGGADVGAVFFAVGPTVSWSRESEKSQEHTQTNVSKNSAQRTGEAVRYHTVYDIQVRSVGHPAQTLAGQVDAHLWATKDRADNAQIGPAPTPAPVARQDGARTHYAPSHIEHGQSLGGSVIDDFSGGDKLYRSIVDVLQNVPGRKSYHLSSDKFVRQFDNADFASGLSASVNDILTRDDKVRTSLSDQQLSHLIDTMLTGPGLTIPLVKNGTFHDYHTNITLRAQLNSVGDLELLSSNQNNGPSGEKTVGTSKTKEKTGTAFADTTTKSLSIGVQGRVAGGIGKASGTALGTVKGGKIWTNSTKVGSDSKSSINRTHGDTLGVDGDLGAREFRQFTGNLTITPQISSYVRLNVNTRRISFGSHGRSVPALVPNNRTPGAGQPAAQNIPLRLLVPEILVTTVPPAQVAAVATAPQAIVNPTNISRLGDGRSRTLDGVEVVTFLGAEHLQSSAKGQLRDASGDPIFEFADGDNSTRIADRLSPESLKSDPRLFSRPVVVDGLHYGRRAADVDGQVAVVLTPVNPQVVSAAEYQKIKQIQAGGSSVGKSKGTTSSIEATFTGVAAMSGTATSTVGNVKSNAFGVFIASVTPWGKSWGTTDSGDLKSAEKTTFENGPVKKTLVRVNIDAQVVAETRVKGNIDKFGLIPGQEVSRSGERFSMPGSVLMWVTDSQLAELRNGPQPVGGNTVVHPPNRTLPPPVSMGQNQVSSLGIGGVTATIDLTGSIANLHAALVTNMGQEAANRLLPSSSLDTSHDNHRELNRFLSDVNRSVNSALNGGKITPLRLEDKWSGRTYYVTLDARVTAAPTFTGIAHVDKLSTEDSVTVSTTKEKTSSRTIGGFFASLRPSVRMVEKTDPVPSGQAAPTTGHGPSSGTISGGLSVDGSASTKATKDTTTPKTDYKQSASISGPVGSYTAPMDFDIRIERRIGVDATGNEQANQVVATDTAHLADVKIQKLAEESLPAPTGGAARHGVAGPINSVAARGDAPTNAWRQAPGHVTLPDTGTFSVEHFFGDMTDVRKAAEQAITESGVTVDTATIAALKAGITPAAFKAGLPAMVNGEFTLPLPGKLGRDLEIHARLRTDPRLGSVSAGVELDGSVKKSTEDKTERMSGPTLSATGIVPNAGGGVSHPSGASELGERRPFGGVFGGTQNDYKLGGTSAQVELKAGTPANTTTSPQSATAIKVDDKITQAMLHNVEFRFVARPKSGQTTEHTGITTMNVNDGYVVRTRPDAANPLPASMTAAATALADTGKTWSEAVKTLHGLESQPVRPDTTAAQTAVTDAETAWWQARDTYNQELDSARMTQAERDQAEADRLAREAAEQRRRDDADRVERERVEAERQAAEDRKRREDEAQAERDRQAQEAKDKAAKEKAAKDKADEDRRAAEERKRQEEARAERERLAQVERDKAEAERKAAEETRLEEEARVEREAQAAKDKAEAEAKQRREEEARAEQERQAQVERDKAEAERQALEEKRREGEARAEREQLAQVERDKAEAERKAAEEKRLAEEARVEREAQAAKDKAAEEKRREDEARAERERLAQVERDKAEAERKAAEEKRLAEEARVEREAQAAKDKAAEEKRREDEARAERERLAQVERDKAEAERQAAEDKQRRENEVRAEQERQAQVDRDKAETERQAAEERAAQEQTENESTEPNVTPEPTPEQRPTDQDEQTEEVPAAEETETDEETDEDSDPEDVPHDSSPKRDDKDGDPDPRQDQSGDTEQEQPEQQEPPRQQEGQRPGSPSNDDLPGDLEPGESYEMTDFSDPSLGDVDFVPLRNSAGEVIGVGFPRAGESQVLLAAFENNAGEDNAFSVAVHHGQDGFSVTRKDGTEVHLDERGVVRLMTSAASTWQQNSSLVFLSCDVTSAELGALTDLVREQGFEGQVRGPDGRVELAASGDVRVLDGGAFRDADGTRQESGNGAFDDSGGTIVFTNLTPAQVRAAMPEYLRTSKGLGPAKQLRMTTGADIRPEVVATMPTLVGNKDLDLVQGQIASNIGSFLNNPRPFTITVGKQSMELRVLAEFDWDGMTVDNAVTDTEKAKPSGKDTRKSENSAGDSRNTDLNVSAFVSAVPPLVVSAGLQIPTGINSAHETKTSKETGSSSDVEVDGMRQVKAPVRLTFELVDSQGRTVARPADAAAVQPVRGDVDLHVPTNLTRPAAPLANLTQAPPSKFGVEEAVSTTTARTFFEQVAADLPAHLREIGAPGRAVLQNFLSDANIKTKLPSMAVYDGVANPDKGWVRSDPLIKSSKSNKWTSKGNAVEMRAVARQVRVIETVDGVKNTDTDSYKNVTSEKNSAKHNVGGNLMVGAGADAKAVFFAVGPTASWSRESEKSQEHTQTTGTKNAAERTGQAVRYHTVFDIEVRTVGHAARTLNGHVDAHLWATKDRADNAQFGPSPVPAPAGRQGAARTHYAPAHIEHGQSLGGSVIDDFSGGDKLYRSIVDVLRNVPGRKGYYLSSDKFVRQFDDPDFARGLSGSINDILTRDDKVRTALSDQQLSHLIDTMLTGPGLTIPLVKKGTFHDYHTNITLRARLNGVGDLELLSSPQNNGPVAATSKTAGSSKTREKTGTAFADTTTKNLSIGVQARVAGGLGKASGTWLGAVKGGKIWTKSTTVGSDGKSSVKRTHGDTVGADGDLGAREFRQFTGNLTITPSIASYVRLNVNTRRISLGSHGKSTPVPVRTTRTTTAVVQPAARVIPLRLLVPEVLVTTTQPAQITIAPPVARPLGPLPRISQLGNGRSRLFDGAEIVSFLGSEHLQSAAKAELTNASGDPIFEFADGENSTRITDRLSPESLTSDPRLFSRPIVVDGLHYGRRAADVDGQVAVALTPVNPQPVSRIEYQKIKNILAGGSSVGKTKGHAYSAETTFTGVAGISAPVTSTINGNKANAFGVFIAAVTPWGKSWGQSKGGDLKSAEKVTFENGPVKKSLVRVNVNAEIVAETRVKGNIDKFGLVPDKDLSRTGQQFTLPGSVLMWVTDAQLAALQNTPVPAPAAVTPTRVLPPPASMGQNKVSSLGIGGVTTTIDLTDRIPHLYRRLAESLGEANAARLLPKSSLDTTHDNHRELTRFLSDVNRAANNTFNGGKITPLRLEDRWSGRTYYVTVEGEFTGDLAFAGIDHVDKLAVEDSVSLSTKKETSRSRTIGGLFASLRPSARIAASSETLKPGEAAPTTGHGPASGTISGGLSLDGALSTKSTKDIVTPKTDYKQSASISGPVARYSGQVNFEIKIERRIGIDAAGNEHADQVVATDKSSFRDVTIQKLAEESLPAPTGNAARHGVAGPITDLALRGDTAIGNWRQAPGRVVLPESGTFAVEHFFGDMKDIRKAAERAITRSGVTVDTATIAALKAGITPAAFKAGLPAMVDGQFVLPLPGDLGRDLEIHARLRDQPRLGSVSAGVEIGGSVKTSNEVKSERKTGPTLSATGIVPNAGGGVSHPEGKSDLGDRRAFGGIFAGTQNDYKLGDKNKQVELKAGAPATTTTSPQSATAIKTDDKITQAMLHNVEFLFVARPKAGQTTTNTGVTARTVNDGYVVRRRPDPANPLPATMTAAATALTTAGTTWSAAVKALEGLRRQQPVPTTTAAEAAVTAAETAWWQARGTYNRELDSARMTQAERDARDRAEQARLARVAEQRRLAREARDREAAIQKAADDKIAADKKAAADKAAADKAAADKAAADKKAADDKAAADKAAADKAAADKKAADDKAAADKAAADKAAADKEAADDKAAADKAAADKAAADKAAADKKAADDKAAADKAAADKAAADKKAADDKAAADKAEREAAEERAAEEKAADDLARKIAAERADAERAAQEKEQRRVAAEQAAAEEQAKKLAAERAVKEAADKAAAELAERAAAEKAAAEVAEREAAERRAAQEQAEKAAAERAEKEAADLRAAEERARKADAERAEKAAAAEQEQKAAEEQAEKEATAKAAAERAEVERALKEAADLRAAEERAQKLAAEQAEKEAAEKAAAEQEAKVAEEREQKAAAEQADSEAVEEAAERARTEAADLEAEQDQKAEEPDETTDDEDTDTEQGPKDDNPKRDDQDQDGDPAQGDQGGTRQDDQDQAPEERQQGQEQNLTEPESPTGNDFPGDLGATESFEMVDLSGPALDDVDFVPLRNAAGDVIGVGFPRAGETQILLTAFENNAGQDNEFAVAVHHDTDGFAVTRRDGTEVRLDERGVVRLMRSAGNGWQRGSSLVFLSCDVTSTELGALTNLVREQGFGGGVRAPDGRVEVGASGDIRVLDGGSFRDSAGTRQAGGGTFDASGGTVVFTPRPNLTDAYETVQPGGVTAFESVRPLRIGAGPGGGFPAFSTAAAGFETQVHPTLRTTDDRSMAINGTNSVNGVEATREAREFFATPEIIAAAREALSRLNSGVELDVQAAAVVLGEGVVLQRVTPRPLNPAQDVCRDFSAQIHGASPDALPFRDLEGNIVQAPVRTQDGVEITGAYHLADGLATLAEQGTPNPDALTAAEFVARDTRPGGGVAGRPLPGVRYGSMLNPSNGTSRMDVVAERTGVNQHAWARPGEMYVMSSIPGEAADGEADFDVNASRDGGVSGRWGYHFATVIAESGDGRSQITLENYARRGQIDRAVRESVERNLAHHAGDLTRIVADLDTRIAAAQNPDEATELGRRREFAAALAEIETSGFDAATPQVRQRVRRAAVADLKLPPLGRQWHFKMYTKNPGESFFEQHALTYEPGGTSAGVNPLVTVAIGGMRTTGSVAVEFERGRRDAETGELGSVRNAARRVARAAIWRSANGMTLPSAVVTGYGNGGRLGPMRARATGLARARAVETAFRAALAAELTRLQGDRLVVRSDDVRVRSVAANPPPLSLRGDGDPSLRRATLDVVFSENSVPLPEAPTEGQPGFPGTRQHSGSVLEDRTWLHSEAATADWMIDPDPAGPAAIDAVRGNAEPMTVSIEDTGVVRGTITPGGERPKIELKHWRHPIAYDLRRMEVTPGKWVREYTVRLGFKSGTPAEVQALVTRAKAGIDHFYNDPGFRLPGGDQLRVRLVHDTGPLPHATIDIRPEGSPVDQLSWTADTHEAVLAHEFGHFLGFYDEYTRLDGHGGAWVFRGGGHAAGGRVAADRVVRDDGLFTAHLHAYVNDTTGTVAEPALKPRNLWLLETRSAAIGSTVLPAALDTEVPGDDDDAFPLLLELWSDAAPARENPEPDDDVLGQDLFGTRKPPPVPAFLAGQDLSGLTAGQGAQLLRLLDMARDAPDRLDMPAESSPKLVHAVSLGGVELPGSHDGWLTVLWTDVPRSKISLAPTENVVVVNIDEVFNAESPMSLQPFFATEMAKPGGRPADILRLEILRRFGGVSVEGDLHDLDLAAVDLDQPWSHDSADNDVFAMPKGHPVTTVLLDQLRDGYRRPEPLPVSPVVDDLSTTELTKKIIQTLVRGLKVRGGDLHLNAVAAVLAGHSKAGVVWTAVLTFLASRPELAAQVNTVTWHHYGIADELAILRKILLSRAANQLVNISPISPPQPFPAELTQLASLNWPDWL
jgi:hypothetical protein